MAKSVKGVYTIEDLAIDLVLSGLIENEEDYILSRKYMEGEHLDEIDLLHASEEKTMYDATKYFNKEFTWELLDYCRNNLGTLFENKEKTLQEDFLSHIMEELMSDDSPLVKIAHGDGLGQKFVSEHNIRYGAYDLIVAIYAMEETIKEGWLEKKKEGKEFYLMNKNISNNS